MYCICIIAHTHTYYIYMYLHVYILKYLYNSNIEQMMMARAHSFCHRSQNHHHDVVAAMDGCCHATSPLQVAAAPLLIAGQPPVEPWHGCTFDGHGLRHISEPRLTQMSVTVLNMTHDHEHPWTPMNAHILLNLVKDGKGIFMTKQQCLGPSMQILAYSTAGFWSRGL